MVAGEDSILLLPAPQRLERLAGTSSAPVEERLDSTIGHPQGYQIFIGPDACRLIGHDAAGIFYGRQTLAQLRRQFADSLPCLEILDYPDFPNRGVMLDISRDKVPTMPTLFSLVDRLAEWKINQLQLYTEHTFAYRGHEEVWRSASPMTAQEIGELDEYCAARFIELVPNQNSFGHMERWLKHHRYLSLAESAHGAETPWGFRWDGPFSLCPTDPDGLALLSDLYSQLLPYFTSPLFNAGCDETFDIGQGRSKDECERRGVHQVYVDFLCRVNELVSRHGRRMMFWGDIVLKEPEIIRQLPPNVIALDWGYEADHPFDDEAARFHESGIPFYVCPGTSSWCSITGRTDNMLANQRAAAAAGLKHGAIGLLNTDWGDYGHLQYLPISFPGLAAGAAMSWCLETNRDLPLARLLDVQVFEDAAGVMGAMALQLGSVYKKCSAKPIHNRSALFSILVPSSTHSDPMEQITAEGLEASLAAIDSAMRHLDRAKMKRPDAALILAEFNNAAEMLRLACEIGESRLDLSSKKREDFANHLSKIISEHRRCWLARNRRGGLEDSISRIDPL